MSHEIRTPLNSIIGLTEFIANSKNVSENKKCIEVIHSSSHILLHLINDILDLSKLNADSVEMEETPFNLHAECQKAIDVFLYHKKEDLELKFEFVGNRNKNHIGDPGRIRQVLINLISNALKFTNSGFVKLTVEEIRQNFFSFTVEDTGIGISDAKKMKIFDEFSQEDRTITRKYGGTGLGLSISRNIVNLLGGNIKVTDNICAGKGSIFSFNAIFKEFNQTIPNNLEQEIEIEQRKRVMVVDDTPMNLFLMKKVFSTTPFNVSYFESGEEALKKLNHEKFDLILMDLQMPGLSGQETTTRIRKLEESKGYQKAVVYALTADIYIKLEDIARFGFDGIFTKPLDKARLFQKINSNPRNA